MHSEIGERFGASISYGDGPPQLFLIIADQHDPSPSIQAFGGNVVMRLGAVNTALASLTLVDALALQKQKGIRAVGGVHLDLQRYKSLLASLGAPEISGPAVPENDQQPTG